MKRKIIDDEFISLLESRDLQIESAFSGLFGGNRRTNAYGSSAEFADYREYTQGDDLRRVDWNLYARFEKIYLKLYRDERQLHHRIYIDASASMDWGKPSKATAALKIAAALGFLSVRALDRVSYYALHEKQCQAVCPPVCGRDAFYTAVNRLNELKFRKETDFKEAFAGEEHLGKDDGLSILISDLLTDSDWMGAVDRMLYHGRQVYVIQILSRDEITPTLSGKILMLDSESIDEEDDKNMRYEITRSSVKAYEQALLYHQNQIKDFCGARGVGFITLCSDLPLEQMLFIKATEVGLIQ